MENINSKNVLEVSNLNTWYGNKKILSNINLNVSHKEIMVIMGHSGSGKSTLESCNHDKMANIIPNPDNNNQSSL